MCFFFCNFEHFSLFFLKLKTVMERCEKIPAETFESRGTRVNEEEPRLWPRVDREGKPLGDAEYVVPSPPEREQQQPSQTISHAELEAYVRSYQDPQVSQVIICLFFSLSLESSNLLPFPSTSPLCVFFSSFLFPVDSTLIHYG